MDHECETSDLNEDSSLSNELEDTKRENYNIFIKKVTIMPKLGTFIKVNLHPLIKLLYEVGYKIILECKSNTMYLRKIKCGKQIRTAIFDNGIVLQSDRPLYHFYLDDGERVLGYIYGIVKDNSGFKFMIKTFKDGIFFQFIAMPSSSLVQASEHENVFVGHINEVIPMYESIQEVLNTNSIQEFKIGKMSYIYMYTNLDSRIPAFNPEKILIAKFDDIFTLLYMSCLVDVRHEFVNILILGIINGNIVFNTRLGKFTDFNEKYICDFNVTF